MAGTVSRDTSSEINPFGPAGPPGSAQAVNSTSTLIATGRILPNDSLFMVDSLARGELVVSPAREKRAPNRSSRSSWDPIRDPNRRCGPLAAAAISDVAPARVAMTRQSVSGEGTPAPHSDVDGLFPAVYDELRRIAHRHLQHEATGHTLTTTDLVHQAYLTLSEQTHAHWTSRAHFMSVAAMAMRRILIDHARGRMSAKRGGGLQRIPLDSAAPTVAQAPDLLVALDEALERLHALDARQ